MNIYRITNSGSITLFRIAAALILVACWASLWAHSYVLAAGQLIAALVFAFLRDVRLLGATVPMIAAAGVLSSLDNGWFLISMWAVVFGVFTTLVVALLIAFKRLAREGDS